MSEQRRRPFDDVDLCHDGGADLWVGRVDAATVERALRHSGWSDGLLASPAGGGDRPAS